MQPSFARPSFWFSHFFEWCRCIFRLLLIFEMWPVTTRAQFLGFHTVLFQLGLKGSVPKTAKCAYFGVVHYGGGLDAKFWFTRKHTESPIFKFFSKTTTHPFPSPPTIHGPQPGLPPKTAFLDDLVSEQKFAKKELAKRK